MHLISVLTFGKEFNSLSSKMIELLFFSGNNCGVCEALKPKLLPVVSDKYPQVRIQVVKVEEEPLIAGQSMVFTLPVVILKVDDKEVNRFARSFSVHQVLDSIEHIVNSL